MKAKIIFILSILALTLSMRLHNADRSQMVGGYQALDVNHLPEDAKEVDQYLRKLHTNFDQAKLISAERQVVAGFNYHFIYESNDKTKQWDIVVYKSLKGQLYENGYTYTETLSNGQKMTAIADPAGMFGPSKDPKPVKVSASFEPKAAKTVRATVAYRDVFPNAIAPHPV